MKEIGGFPDISANHGCDATLFSGALLLNSCANALEFLIRERGYRKIRVPAYTCPAVNRAVARAGAEIITYYLDAGCMPIATLEADCTPLIYTNYFGLLEDNVLRLAAAGVGLVVDNAQALYSPPVPGADCLYSPRKFFGLPDGGILYPATPLPGYSGLGKSISFDRCFWLFKRADTGAASAFADMQESERSLQEQPPLRMSESTRCLMAGIDPEHAASRRRANWASLHRNLADSNNLTRRWRLAEKLPEGTVPLCYPYSPARGGASVLRERLIRRGIYIPRYWPGLEDKFIPGMPEYTLVHDLLPLPLDQRYLRDDMEHVARMVFECASQEG